MNIQEWQLLLDSFRNNELTRKKFDQLVISRAVLNTVDLVKTRVWGLLSKELLNENLEKTWNMAEIRAFCDYVTSTFILKDFRRPFEKIENKINWLPKHWDWYILELIITDILMRKHSNNSQIKIKRWIPELDSEYKTDMLTSYKHKWMDYKFWVQITTIHWQDFIINKDEQLKTVIWKINKWEQIWKFIKKMQLDSMIFAQLNWIISSSLHKTISPLKEALRKWKKSKYKWTILDYISDRELVKWINKFCNMYIFVIENFFKIVNSNLNKKWFINKLIKLGWWRVIKIHYSQNEKTIRFSFYENKEFLFSMKFYLNEKLMSKIKWKTDKNIL